MSELSDLQRWMADLLRRRSALPSSDEISRTAMSHIRANDRLSPVEQLEIYREQFWLRHTASLLEDFPGMSGIIGQEDWERLVEGYLVEHAPTSWTLRDLGGKLPGYVERASWLPHHALCVDMTRLEWAYIELFDAPEPAPLDPDELLRIVPDAWPSATILLSPALRLQRTRYPVAELRKKLRAVSTEPILIPEPAEEHLVLYRGTDRSLYHRAVSRGAFELLTELGEGAELLIACNRAAERCPEEALEIGNKVGDWFGQWGRLGWIAGVVARTS